MQKFMAYLSIALLAVSLFLVSDRLFTPLPINISLESGEQVTTSTSAFYTISEVLLLIVCSFVIGAAATYLYYNAEAIGLPSSPKGNGHPLRAANSSDSRYESILPLLKHGERNVVLKLINSKDGILQSRLAASLGVSKVKMTRLLSSLEIKGLVRRERQGFTNLVMLSKTQ